MTADMDNAAGPYYDVACHVQSLAAELYDEIFRLTFASKRTTQRITCSHEPDSQEHISDYKSPAILSVSKSTRYMAATSYYGNTIFEFDHPDTYWAWVTARPLRHVELLKNLRVVIDVDDLVNACYPDRYPTISASPMQRLVEKEAHAAVLHLKGHLECVSGKHKAGVMHVLVSASDVGLQDFLMNEDGETTQ